MTQSHITRGSRFRQVIGLDIGGANLKAACTTGAACSEAFEIWRAPHGLAPRIASLLARLPPAERMAVTMTAELADCFETKRDGVEFILREVASAAGGLQIVVWLTSGQFVSAGAAIERAMEVAAANWHALATWAGRLAPDGRGILIDIGTTTTDLIPLSDGRPVPLGHTDVERLLSGELVYTGFRRTPVCAVAPRVPFRGHDCPLAAEWFATMLDVYLVLGMLPEDPEDSGTANGRPATIAAAHDRLARAICCDRSEVSRDEARAIAAFLAESQMRLILEALEQVIGKAPVATAVVSGAGNVLARRILARHPAAYGCRIVSLSDELSPGVAAAACAYAVATLAAESVD